MRVLLASLMMLAGQASAEAMERSLLPLPNPHYLSQTVAELEAPLTPVAATMTVPRPKPRPDTLIRKVAAARAPVDDGLPLTALRPKDRPDEELAAAEPPKKEKRKRKEKVSTKGSICGVAAIKGQVIAPIISKVQGCGVPDAVMVTSVSGVRLSQAATIDCTTAKALNSWVDKVVQPAFGGQVVQLQVAAHYMCRSRNNVKGAKISEHGKGHAIDIAAFVLSNGKMLTVLDNYNKTLRRVHDQACGIFGTTLGPGSDGYHENHIHLDTASYRGRPYCR